MPAWTCSAGPLADDATRYRGDVPNMIRDAMCDDPQATADAAVAPAHAG
jgi:hypothetical protein